VSEGDSVGCSDLILVRFPEPEFGAQGFRFPPGLIVLTVWWYLRFDPSSRYVEDLLAERGLAAKCHSTSC
jgi:transposase-like protein